MGNAAAKELKETKLGEGTLHKLECAESMCIAASLVTKGNGITNAKNIGNKWVNADVDDEEEVFWSSKNVGMIRSHSIIKDKDEKLIATVITEKMGMTTITNYVCRSNPTFDGQQPLTAEELKKAGIVDDQTICYKFSKIETKRQMTTAKSTYSIVTGEKDGYLTYQDLYRAEKLSAMGFMAIFRDVTKIEGDDDGGTPIAKAATKGMSMSPIVEAAIGVDLLAIVLTGYTLVGNDNGAGALAGAGVV